MRQDRMKSARFRIAAVALAAAGASYVWTWMRQDTSGKQTAGDGQSQVVVTMPGKTPDRLTQTFDIKTTYKRNK